MAGGGMGAAPQPQTSMGSMPVQPQTSMGGMPVQTQPNQSRYGPMVSYAPGNLPTQNQQGGFGGFGGDMPPQQFGGFGGYGMPQQQFGGFGGYGMPPPGPFGGFGGYGMPPQQSQSMLRQQPISQQQMRRMPQQGFGPDVNNYAKPMRDPMRPMVSQMPPEENQPSAAPAPSTDMRAMMDPFRQQANQMMEAQNAFLAARGMPTSNEVDYTDPRRGMGINVAQPPRQQPQAQVQPNPYMQQLGQESPRMRAMRRMQRMRLNPYVAME